MRVWRALVPVMLLVLLAAMTGGCGAQPKPAAVPKATPPPAPAPAAVPRTASPASSSPRPKLPPVKSVVPPIEASFLGLSITVVSASYDKYGLTIAMDVANGSECTIQAGDEQFYLVSGTDRSLTGLSDETGAPPDIRPGTSSRLILAFPAPPLNPRSVTLICGFHYVEYMMTFEPEFNIMVP